MHCCLAHCFHSGVCCESNTCTCRTLLLQHALITRGQPHTKVCHGLQQPHATRSHQQLLRTLNQQRIHHIAGPEVSLQLRLKGLHIWCCRQLTLWCGGIKPISKQHNTTSNTALSSTKKPLWQPCRAPHLTLATASHPQTLKLKLNFNAQLFPVQWLADPATHMRTTSAPCYSDITWRHRCLSNVVTHMKGVRSSPVSTRTPCTPW